MPEGHNLADQLSTADWIASLKPTMVEAFKHYSNQEIDEYLATLAAQRELEKDRSKKRVYEAKKKLALSSEIRTCIITLSIDQRKTWRESVKKIKEIIDLLISRNPPFLEDAIISAEFYTATGWNPHIHIFSYLSMTPGKLAQRLRKCLKNYLYTDLTQTCAERIIYKVHCQQGTHHHQADYLCSLKNESKREHQDKDKKFRKENEILDYYII